jgi:hypothetical protein
MAALTLRAWTEAYLRHRDLFEHKIASITPEGGEERGRLIVTHKDKSSFVCVVDDLTEASLEALKEEQLLFVARNRKANVDFLLAHWARFAKHPTLKIVFANVAHNEKWVIRPSTHDKVAEQESLALGLQTMHESIPVEGA